jgi:hypothetical protein
VSIFGISCVESIFFFQCQLIRKSINYLASINYLFSHLFDCLISQSLRQIVSSVVSMLVTFVRWLFSYIEFIDSSASEFQNAHCLSL